MGVSRVCVCVCVGGGGGWGVFMRYNQLTFTRRLKQRGFQSNTKTGVYIMFLAIALRRPRSCSYF